MYTLIHVLAANSNEGNASFQSSVLLFSILDLIKKVIQTITKVYYRTPSKVLISFD